MVTNVVTLKKVFKETGTSKKTGKPWTRYDLLDTNDTRYSTFKAQLGQIAENAEGKTVSIEFRAEDNGGYVNNILEAIDLNGHSGEPLLSVDPTVKAVTSGDEAQKAAYLAQFPSPADQKQTQITRHGALARAIESVAAGIIEWKAETPVHTLFQIADEYVKYIEQGSEAFGQF